MLYHVFKFFIIVFGFVGWNIYTVGIFALFVLFGLSGVLEGITNAAINEGTKKRRDNLF